MPILYNYATMPAINLARLRMHTAELAEHFSDPGKFVHELEGFLEFYADRTRRAVQAGSTPTLIATYNIPRQAMNQLLIELKDHIDLAPQSALELTDALWAVESLETRVLAARILGMIEITDPQSILSRLEEWIKNNEETRITTAISQFAIQSLIKHFSNAYLEFLEAGLSSSDAALQGFALNAYTGICKQKDFDDLPAVFRSLNTWIKNYRSRFKLPLLELLTVLAERSPGETAFYLRYNMAQDPPKDLLWIGRKVIKHLPEDLEIAIHEVFHQF